jgi:prepilin-type N-terminal cleavage/methylation domain-containing protein
MISNAPSKQSLRIKKGFTLIEVMVSIAIMALIVSVAFAGLRIGLNSWERGSRRVDELAARATLERLLNRQLALANAMPMTNDQKALFRGTSSRVEFISDYSAEDGSGDFRKIDYAVKDGHFFYGERQLYGYVPSENEELPTHRLGDFSSVRFRYLFVDDNGAFKWFDEWKLGMGLPTAVETNLNGDSFVTRLVNR